MTKNFVEHIKETGVRPDRRGYPRRLGKLFPCENPYSPAMWRLAIIRDDIDREVEGTFLPGMPHEDPNWEHAYFLRRISISVLEAKNLIVHDIPKMLEEQPLQKSRHDFVVEKIRTLQTLLAEADELLEPFRQGIGGHVRPNNANPERETTDAYEVRGLRTLAAWPGTLTLDRNTEFGTSYRDFTKLSILFVWPEVTDDDSLKRKLEVFIPKVGAVASALQAMIDGILYAFWLEIGALDPTR
jgi:hypothetical protein